MSWFNFGSNDKKTSDAKEISLVKSLVKESSELESMLLNVKQYVKKENNISKVFSNWTAALEAHKSSFSGMSKSIHQNNVSHIQAIEDTILALNVLSKTIRDLELKFLSVKMKIPLTNEDKALILAQINKVEKELNVVDLLDTRDLKLLDEDLRKAA
jgi:hypothetical protein